MNLDPFTVPKAERETIEKGLSNLFYELRKYKENTKISKFVSEDDEMNVKTFKPFNNFLEYYEIQPEDVEHLIARIKQVGYYKYFVIELSAEFSIANRRIIELSDKTFFASGEEGRRKSQIVLENIGLDPKNTELAKKMSIVKYDGVIERIIN